MQWFKHRVDAGNDPFIDSLVQHFGPAGYTAWFRTLELYFREFKPEPGWYYRAGLKYWKKYVGFYRNTTMVKWISFVTTYKNTDETLAAKFGMDAKQISDLFWHKNCQSMERLTKDSQKIRGIFCESSANLVSIFCKSFIKIDGDQIYIFIPNTLKYMDKYTSRKWRENLGIGLAVGKSVSPEQDKEKDLNRKQPRVVENDGAAIMAMLDDLCRQVEAIDPDNTNGNFAVRAFIVKHLKQGLHPYAMRDGIKFLLKCWQDEKRKVANPWGLALSTAKTCQQNYEPLPTSPMELAIQYGPYFTNQ